MSRLQSHEDRPDLDRDRGREGLDRIHAALRGLRFGSVTAVVQDGVIVQVDRTEKVRVTPQSPRRA